MPVFAKRNKAGRKLTSEKVAEMRKYYAEGATQGALAKYFGISAVQVGRVVRGESWSTSADVLMPSEEEMQASARRMVELQESLRATPVVKASLISPLDGGDAQSESGGLSALQQRAKELLGK